MAAAGGALGAVQLPAVGHVGGVERYVGQLGTTTAEPLDVADQLLDEVRRVRRIGTHAVGVRVIDRHPTRGQVVVGGSAAHVDEGGAAVGPTAVAPVAAGAVG
jgi:hypothetical protein